MRKSEIVMAALIAVIGLMIFAAPAVFIKVIVIILGIVSIINGSINIMTVSALIDDSHFKHDVLIRGWSSVIVGILAVALPLVFAATMWTIMLYVLAVYLVISSGMEFYAVSCLKKAGISVKQYVVEAFLTLLFAVLLFIIPGKIGILLVRIIAVLFMLTGAALIVYYVKSKPVVIVPDSVADDIDAASDTAADFDKADSDNKSDKE